MCVQYLIKTQEVIFVVTSVTQVFVTLLSEVLKCSRALRLRCWFFGYYVNVYIMTSCSCGLRLRRSSFHPCLGVWGINFRLRSCWSSDLTMSALKRTKATAFLRNRQVMRIPQFRDGEPQRARGLSIRDAFESVGTNSRKQPNNPYGRVRLAQVFLREF